MTGVANREAGDPPGTFARWCRVDTGPGTDDEMIADRWRIAFRDDWEFWRGLDAAAAHRDDLQSLTREILGHFSRHCADPECSSVKLAAGLRRDQVNEWRKRADQARAATAETAPRAVTLEIIEREHRVSDDNPASTIIVPNDVRINGMPVYTSADEPIRVHGMDFPNREAAMVTLTLFVRKLTVAAEGDL